MERKPRILAAVRPQGGVAVLRALGEYADVVSAALRAAGILCPALRHLGAVAFIDMPLLDADNATDTDFRSQVLRHIR